MWLHTCTFDVHVLPPKKVKNISVIKADRERERERQRGEIERRRERSKQAPVSR